AVQFYAGPLAQCNIQGGKPPLTNRLADLVPVINLGVLGYTGANAITSIGDVLRVDLGAKLANFPNGRRLDTSGGANGNTETVDVVDTEIKLLFCGLVDPAVNTGILAGNALTP